MSTVHLVFPNQLFEHNPAFKKSQPIVLVEENLFFNQYHFHKQKLVFHRASMKAYCAMLRDKKYTVRYIEARENNSDIRNLLPYLKEQGVAEIHYTDVMDNWLQQRISSLAAQLDIRVIRYESPLFLSSTDQIVAYFANKKRFYQADFYIHQRKTFKILIDKNGIPVGGKWSFDTENRLKYPKGRIPPHVAFPKPNEYWKEAVGYVERHFYSNYGEVDNTFIYPTTHKESQAWLTEFLQSRFCQFGNYEDAIVSKKNILHHSVLAPMLNVGLLSPKETLDTILTFGSNKNIPLNSLEGFVRQVLGWREFIRGVYQAKGVQQRTTNHWKFKRKIPASFWKGTTGIDPVDSTIKKVLATGYCHHIERLMVLGNFMLLCEFDPDEVYKWFMELFIDSYDWVMVPNIYGMSQFADGGLMATKPYISGSNYLMKMSDYRKGNWQLVWDGLFWRFMNTHRDFFIKNARLSMLIKTLDKMPDQKRNDHLRRAGDYLAHLSV